MPRLMGKQSNSGWGIGSFVILAIAIMVAYTGFINVIPGFDQKERPGDQSHTALRHWKIYNI